MSNSHNRRPVRTFLIQYGSCAIIPSSLFIILICLRFRGAEVERRPRDAYRQKRLSYIRSAEISIRFRMRKAAPCGETCCSEFRNFSQPTTLLFRHMIFWCRIKSSRLLMHNSTLRVLHPIMRAIYLPLILDSCYPDNPAPNIKRKYAASRAQKET